MNLLHLFIPHYNNNYRAKILHHTSLLVLIFIFTLLSTLGILVSKSHPEVLGITYQISDQELLNLVNYERTQKGLTELKIDLKLETAAKEKADHMFKNNYWAHFAPDGTTPWVFIRNQGYEYVYAGENLAKGYTTSYDAVKAWMNSPTHKANILSDKYTDVGFAIEPGKIQGEDTILIVQMLGSTQVAAIQKSPTETGNQSSSQTLGSSKIDSEIRENPLIDLVFSTKVIVFAILSFLIMALIIDLIVVEKNKIPRVVGNNLDHIILLTLFSVFIIVSKLGSIL